MGNFNSRQFPKVYEALDVSIPDLGVVMLDVEPFTIKDLVPNSEDDLFYGTTPDTKYAQGAVVENTAHVTLLYGLMEQGDKWRNEIETVLEGWTPPPLVVYEVGAFPPATKDQKWAVIVAHIVVSSQLLEGHERLSLLPHINTFPGYKAHLTLAYVKNDPDIIDKWVTALEPFVAGKSFTVQGINLGDTN